MIDCTRVCPAAKSRLNEVNVDTVYVITTVYKGTFIDHGYNHYTPLAWQYKKSNHLCRAYCPQGIQYLFCFKFKI
jgi:hypothetical protein